MPDRQNPTGGVIMHTGFGIPGNNPIPLEQASAARLEMLIIGNFGGPNIGQATRLNGDDLKAILERYDARAHFVMKNCFGESPSAIQVDIPINSIKDLSPRTFASRIPEIVASETFMKLNEAGEDLPAEARSQKFEHLAARFRNNSKLQDEPPSRAQGTTKGNLDADYSVDRLLELFESPQADTFTAKDAIDAIMPRAKASKTATSNSQAAELIQTQIYAACTHPSWLELEKSWRSLRMLISCIERNPAAAITLWDCGEEHSELPKSVSDLNDVFDIHARPRWRVVLILGPFEGNQRSMDRLNHIAKLCNDFNTPAIVTVDPAFFGYQPAQVAKMDNPANLIEGPSFAAWRGLIDRPESHSIVACWNDVLLREADENIPELWGDAALIVAAQLLNSHTRTGWPTELCGSRFPISNLDLSETETADHHKIAIPLRTMIDFDLASYLAATGLTCPVCRADRDAAWIMRAPMLSSGRKMIKRNDADQTASDLATTLVSTMIGDLCSVTLQKTDTRFDAQKTATTLTHALHEFVSTTGAGAKASVSYQTDVKLKSTTFDLHIQFGDQIMSGNQFSFDFSISTSE